MTYSVEQYYREDYIDRMEHLQDDAPPNLGDLIADSSEFDGFLQDFYHIADDARIAQLHDAIVRCDFTQIGKLFYAEFQTYCENQL